MLARETWEAIGELVARAALQESRKTQARRRTGQYHRVTKGIEGRKRDQEDLLGEVKAAGHAGDGSS